MKVVGVEGLSVDEVFARIGEGSRFVVYEYCISILLMSFKRASAIHLVGDGETRWTPALGCTGASLLLGWWGIPWGPIWTIGSIFSNLSGGRDVTEEMMRTLAAGAGDPRRISKEESRDLEQVFS